MKETKIELGQIDILDDSFDSIQIDDFVNNISQDEINENKIILMLIKMRKNRGMSQNSLAKCIGVPNTTISRIENFSVHPTLLTLMKISRALGVSISVTPDVNYQEEKIIDSKSNSPVPPVPVDNLCVVCNGAMGAAKTSFLCNTMKRSYFVTYILSDFIKKRLCQNKFRWNICEEERYFDDVENIFSTYISCIRSFFAEDVVDQVYNFSRYLRLAFQLYQDGNHHEAYDTFKDGIEKYIDIDFLIKDIPTGKEFYRCRKLKGDSIYSEEEMLNIPFKKRYKVSTQRYSYPGLPCLYLGESKKVCEIELDSNCNELQTARIAYKSNRDFRILDLTSLLDFSSFEEEKNAMLLKSISLLLACSTVIERNGKTVNYRQEYVLPQLLLEYVIDKTILDEKRVIGIKYYSVKDDFLANSLNESVVRKNEMINYAFPERKKGFLRDIFSVSERDDKS